MITNTQYAWLVGLPTGLAILGMIVRTMVYRRWMRVHREGTERSDAQHLKALLRHKLLEGNQKHV